MAPGPIHVISLGRTPQRWRTFCAENPGLTVQRFEAVDGLVQSPAALVAAGIVTADLAYTPGALGCALSHIALWRTCVEGGSPVTVCEDDAVLRTGFAALAHEALAATPEAELALWGWNFDSVLAGRLFGDTPFAMGFDQARLRTCIETFRQDAGRPAMLRLHRALGTPCYTITPAGAARLLAMCLPLRPLSVYVPLLDRTLAHTGIDIAMNAVYPTLSAYVAFPPLAITPNWAADSTVEPPPA